MPIGTCDPASRGDQFNTLEMSKYNGDIMITCRYGWDGTSVMPNCDGPVHDIRVQNVSDKTYWADLPFKKKGNKWIEIPSGTDSTVSGSTLNQIGLTKRSDLDGVRLIDTKPA